MSVMVSDDKKELVVTCKCGCKNAVNIKIDDEDKDSDYYALVTYLNGNWYRDQNDSILRCIGRRLKKIWAIIRSKDYYYSDVLMSCEDFERFKKYVNQFKTKDDFSLELDGLIESTAGYYINEIGKIIIRINENCEEKNELNDYRMYDDVIKITNMLGRLSSLFDSYRRDDAIEEYRRANNPCNVNKSCLSLEE